MNKAISVSKITKSFPGVLANSDINLEINEGTIHAIVGENGAGKSTLMKILYGMVKPDSGDIAIFDNKTVLNSPKDAIDSGLGMVHQHFMLADNLTVLESVILGIDKATFKNINLKRYTSEITEVINKYNLNIDLNKNIDELGVGEKQRVEILKVLFRGAKILILDEPTAVLVPQEVDELFNNLRDLKNNGVTIIFISHKLDEVLEIAEDISVMRGGIMVNTVSADGISKKDLAEMMIGKSLPKPPKRQSSISTSEILSIENLSAVNENGKKVFENISFKLNSSEILGIAGVEGNGQREIVEAIIGIHNYETGTIKLENNTIDDFSIRERLNLGISFIPEDRQAQALIMDMSLTNNVILGRQSLAKYKTKLTTVNLTNAAKASESVVENFDVKTPNTGTIATALSGGNQQKYVVGRELEDNPTLLIASQPTRGIDIGAQALIWEKLRNTRDEGLGVLLISADLEELIGLSDRIVVIYQGQFVAELQPEEITPEILGSYMTGLKK
tara:strand:+ start:2061 stop:3572 length:1512 start_codon:yes stop_codon:yes gene_type:complete